jgi:glycosyltransferase involved in cell wall biosynthesis
MKAGASRGIKHVGINAHLLASSFGYRRAGIHHYISQLLTHLPAPGNDYKYTVFTNNKSDLILNKSLELVSSQWPTSRRLVRILWEQLIWPLAAARHQVDLLHSMAFVTPIFSGRDTIVTVYDLSFMHFPDRFPRLQRAYLTGQTKRSCRQARRVMTISESGRQDVHRLFDIPLDRIDVVYPGIDAAFSPRPAAEVELFRRRNALLRPYILHVGTLQPRKNIPTLIDAFDCLKRSDLDLVLVGGKGWLYDEIFARVDALGLKERVRFAGYVTDADLPLWYNSAEMVVLPSIYEGFGLPAAQAMACGTPVIASNISAIPEVTGDAALLFSPYDASALCNHMTSVLDDPQITATMREQGLSQVKKFTWQNAGQKMQEVYQKTLEEGK